MGQKKKDPVRDALLLEAALKKDILSKDEAAIYIGVSIVNMPRLIQKEGLPARKILNKWRIDKKDLREWVRVKGLKGKE